MIITTKPCSQVWLDGKQVSLSSLPDMSLSHGMQYGSCAFEGIRAYQISNGSLNLFKGLEHYQRLEKSAKFLGWEDYPYSPRELVDKTYQLIKVNGLTDCYIRPLVFLRNNALKIATESSFFSLVIFTMPWKNFFDRKKHIAVSLCPNQGPSGHWRQYKLSAHYAYSLPFQLRAKRNGFDDILRCDQSGVCFEFSAANLGFIIGENVYLPQTMSGLNGITKNTLLQICHQMAISVRTDRQLLTETLPKIDALFSMGTATEVCPISQVNNLYINSQNNKILQEIIYQYHKITSCI